MLTPKLTRKAVFCLVALLVAASLVLFLQKSSIAVHGQLSQQDLSDIVAAVRRDIWRQAFPDFSWRTIERTPRAIWAIVTSRVSEVSDTFQNRAVVKGRFRLGPQIVGPGMMVYVGCDSWVLRKDAGGWAVKSHGWNAKLSHPSPPTTDGGLSFSAALSNESRLSFEKMR